MQNFLLCLVLSFFCLSANAQLERTVHQSVDLSQTLNVSINVAGDYELIHWPGDHFLFETNVVLEGGSKHLLNFFLKEGRYKVETDTRGYSGRLYSKDMARKPLKYKGAECREKVTVKIFVPEFFSIQNAQRLLNTRLQENGVYEEVPTDWTRTKPNKEQPKEDEMLASEPEN